MIFNWPNWGTTQGQLTVSGDEARSGVASFEIQFPDQDSWDIRVTRLTPDANDTQIIDASTWQRLVSMSPTIESNPYALLNLQKQHTLFEAKWVASSTIGGNVQRINARVISRLRRFDRNGNFTALETGGHPGNPAKIIMDILTGYSIQNHSDKVGDDFANWDGGWIRNSQIDFPSFVDFSNRCNEWVDYVDKDGVTQKRRRYSINLVLDTDAPIIETCQSILSMCRARLIINRAGKFAIMMDEARTVPRQLFTPANTWNFSASLDFVDQPHAFRVNFISPELGFQKSSIMAYDDTHDEKSATIIEDLETFGITNWHQAAMYGRYMMAQGILRRETFNLEVDTENLVVQVGDRVDLQHDVPGFGGIACRVRDVQGNRVFIDQPIGAGVGGGTGLGWVYTLRKADGTIENGKVPASGDDYFDVPDAINFQTGDLVVIGERKAPGDKTITVPFLVTQIRPTNDLKAELSLVRYDPAVYNVDTETIPPWNPSFGQDGQSGTALYVSTIDVQNKLIYQNRYPFTESTINFKIGPASKLDTLDHIIIRHIGRLGTETELVSLPPDARTWTRVFSSLGSDFDQGSYEIVPVSQLGYEGQSISHPTVKVRDHTAPQPPTNLKAEYQTNGTTLVSWTPNTVDPDVIRYNVYYGTTSTFSAASFLQSVDWTESSLIQQTHREGYYFVKAMDSSGHESSVVSTQVGHPVPGQVQGLQVHVKDNKALLNWNLLVDPFVNQYQIYYSPNNKETDQSKGTLVGVTDGNTDTFPLTTVDGSYWVVAQNTFGNTGAPARTSTFTPDVAAINLQVSQQLVFEGRFPYSQIKLVWSHTGNPVEYRVYFRDRKGTEHLIDTTIHTESGTKYSTIFSTDFHSGTFIVQPITQYGTVGVEAQQAYTIIKDTTPPVPPEGFFANIVGRQIELNWQPSISTDIEGYQLRYSPLFGHPEWTHGTVLTDTDHITLNATVPARTGTYMLRAIDTSGNYSTTVYQRSAIETLPDINVITTQKPEPAWGGTMSGLAKVGDHLEGDGVFTGASNSQQQVSEGTYTYSAPIDLGAVYEGVRIVSKLDAYGIHYGDVMATWVPLASAIPLAGAEAEDWDAWIEYRTSDSPVVMADWVPLNNVNADPLAGGSGNWGDWRRFYVADITARYVQFRIQTRSYNTHTKVKVVSGLVEIDMPDRIYSQEDIAVTGGEVVVPIAPAFREIKAAAVSIDGITGGGHHIQTIQARVVNKTPSAVTVQFFDNNNTKTNEDGQIDLIVTGYGRVGTTSI